MEDTVSNVSRIRQLAVEWPAEPALRHVGLDGAESATTWPQLDRRSSQLAGALAARGLSLGDTLGLGLRNSLELVLGVFAAWKLGAVPVPIRWDVPAWELHRLREVVAARVYLDSADLLWIRETAHMHAPELPDVLSPSLNGICSSGSTGLPKVILAGRPALYDPQRAIPHMAMWRAVPRPQTVLVLAPMHHITGFSTLFSLLGGDRLVVLEKFDAARAVEVIERCGISTFAATPTMLQRMADLPGIGERDLSSIDWIMQGAAPMPPALVHRWASLIGAERIAMAYGMTEGLGMTALRGDEWMTHQGSVGRGVRGTELRVLDPDGHEVPTGEIGDIYLRSVFFGGYRYLGEVPRLRQTVDGFVASGDMGYLDQHGHLYLLDRRVDLIVTGGSNVFPAEVEAALIDHAQIADVVVVGLRDPEWGRRVHAVIQPVDPAAPPDPGEVIGYAKSRLAPYKVPKTVEIVAAIPRSEATKVNRGALVAARGG